MYQPGAVCVALGPKTQAAQSLRRRRVMLCRVRPGFGAINHSIRPAGVKLGAEVALSLCLAFRRAHGAAKAHHHAARAVRSQVVGLVAVVALHQLSRSGWLGPNTSLNLTRHSGSRAGGDV